MIIHITSDIIMNSKDFFLQRAIYFIIIILYYIIEIERLFTDIIIMNPVIKIINKVILTLGKIVGSIDAKTADTIKKAAMFIIFIGVLGSAFFGIKKGQDSARIKMPSLVSVTNEVFDIHVQREKGYHSMTQVLDDEKVNIIGEKNLKKYDYYHKNEFTFKFPKDLIDPDQTKQKINPKTKIDDRLFDDTPAKKKKQTIRQLKKENKKVSKNEQPTIKVEDKKKNTKKNLFDLLKDKITGKEKKKPKKKKNENSIKKQQLPINIIKYPKKHKNFYLTFDVGTDNEHIPFILNTLSKYSIKATFFITGNFMNKYPSDVKRIVNSGHIVGNHTLSHKQYFSRKQLLYELKETERIFKRITHKDLWKIWRAPYLQHLHKGWVLKAAQSIGYQHIDASLVVMDDWIKNPYSCISNKEFLHIFRNTLNFKNNNRIFIQKNNSLYFKKKATDYTGVIMLMHTGRFRSGVKDFVYCLEPVIRHLSISGYTFDNCAAFVNSQL